MVGSAGVLLCQSSTLALAFAFTFTFCLAFSPTLLFATSAVLQRGCAARAHHIPISRLGRTIERGRQGQLVKSKRAVCAFRHGLDLASLRPMSLRSACQSFARRPQPRYGLWKLFSMASVRQSYVLLLVNRQRWNHSRMLSCGNAAAPCRWLVPCTDASLGAVPRLALNADTDLLSSAVMAHNDGRKAGVSASASANLRADSPPSMDKRLLAWLCANSGGILGGVLGESHLKVQSCEKRGAARSAAAPSSSHRLAQATAVMSSHHEHSSRLARSTRVRARHDATRTGVSRASRDLSRRTIQTRASPRSTGMPSGIFVKRPPAAPVAPSRSGGCAEWTNLADRRSLGEVPALLSDCPLPTRSPQVA